MTSYIHYNMNNPKPNKGAPGELTLEKTLKWLDKTGTIPSTQRVVINSAK
jgi:hypothetical protein